MPPRATIRATLAFTRAANVYSENRFGKRGKERQTGTTRTMSTGATEENEPLQGSTLYDFEIVSIDNECCINVSC